MKTLTLAPLALLIAAGCSQPGTTNTADAVPSEATTNTTKAADVAANPRPDSSIIDESKPHEHTAENAHPEPMDMAMVTPAAGDSAATKGYKQAMMKMMQGTPPYTGDADVDFNKQMRIHHLAAVDMAQVQIAHGTNPESKVLAQKIVTDQRREIAQIDAWLQKRGQ
ncbi:MAG: hypothetical protein JWN21_1749 [Sphingomonas bacterium]|jgi:hypothetical protein|uniref:DUF305 domain-containing protein n=1 Tax=Sphingomonas bacterium TaxID=1895847 RepID=UPI00262F8503|nr:DUF305 domain-containing protein [Sphingomonas bacterium]MDB5696206.1 hypothetical protein [Sphingomonas bacterium]